MSNINESSTFNRVDASVVVECININKQFGTLKASDNVSLSLRTGEIHALIGPNGAGKSTLIQQVAGELPPDSGIITIQGTDVTKLGTARRAALGLARTFQVSALALEHTVLQNVLLGSINGLEHSLGLFKNVMRNDQLAQHALQALEQVGLDQLQDTTAAQLSHGQRRQLEIAVALSMQPVAFIMDEPMAGLGTSGTKDLTGLLDELRHKAPILLVEHDMDAVFALADKVSVLVSGKIIATGTCEQIRQHPEVKHAYLGDSA